MVLTASPIVDVPVGGLVYVTLLPLTTASPISPFTVTSGAERPARAD